MATIIENEDSLIRDNIALIKKLAKSFKPKNNTELDEYIQEGRIGLLKAIRKHNPEKGKLSTIAWNSIRWEILRYIEKKRNKKNLAKKNTEEEVVVGTYDIQNIDVQEEFYYLTDEEKKVVKQKLDGNNFTEIGKMNGYSRGWANKIFQNASLKIKEKYEEENTI